MTISIKATRAQTSLDATSIVGPTTVIKGSSNTYTITDFDSFSVYSVVASAGTVSRSNETITLVIESGEVANTMQLTITRDGSSVIKNIALGAQVIGTPSITSPASGSTDVNIPVTLLASAFTPYPTGAATHASSDWIVKNSTGTIIWQSLADTVNKTSITIPTAILSPATQYFAQVRYTGNVLGSSAYSTANQFTTSAVSIVRPSITSPVNGAVGVGGTPTFTSSVFTTIPAGSDTHSSTSWRVKSVSTGAVVWSSLNNTVNKTSVTIPTGTLVVSTEYTVEVQYSGATLPTSQWSSTVSFTTASAFAYDRYMAVGTQTTPYALIYGQDVDTFVKLPNPAILPNFFATGIAFSPNGLYCAVTCLSAPYLTVYKRTGDSFVKLADPAVLPEGGAYSVSFSEDSKYLALGASSSSGRLIVYEINNDVFSATPSVPAPPSSGLVRGVAFSGVYMATALYSSSFAIIYKRTGSTFDRVSASSLPTSGDAGGVAFSPDGVYLAFAHDLSPYVTIAKRSGDVFNKLTDPATLPNSTGNGVAFSPDGVYLAVATTSFPYVTIYKRSGDTFVKLANPSTLPAGKGNAVAFSSDGLYLTVAHAVTPCLTTYKRTGDSFVKLADPAVLPTTPSSAVAVYPPVLGR